MRRILSLGLSLGCLGALGCGDDDSSENPTSGSSATGGGSSASASGGAGGTSQSVGGSPASGGQGQGAGGAAAGGAGGGGGSSGSSLLYPLGLGASWTYQVSAVGAGSVCAPGMHTSTVTGRATRAGKTGFVVSSACAGIGPSTLAPGEGDEVFLYYNGGWASLVATPVQAGVSWSYFNTSFTWEDAGSVTVPAGTFDDCWRAKQNVTYEAFTTYCRGVGPVRSYSSDLLGNGWDMQLSSFVGP